MKGGSWSQLGEFGLSSLMMASALQPLPLMAQATVRADGVQLQVRRMPDAIELVIQDAGAGGALEQRRELPL